MQYLKAEILYGPQGQIGSLGLNQQTKGQIPKKTPNIQTK